jgi:2-polyprenyl-3-methyl-5-hydroxy-6-metoxy-1,4-benzoquinol methylase
MQPGCDGAAIAGAQDGGKDAASHDGRDGMTTSETARTTTDSTATESGTAEGAADDGLPRPAASVDEFAERVFGAVLATQEVQAMYLGDRLGWYRALAAGGAMTSTELAEATGSHERYAREWLEHQAVAGYVTVDRADAAATERRYTLPTAHAEALTDDDSPGFVAPLAKATAAFGNAIDRIAEAYRTGGGVSWDEFGDDARTAQASANRRLFLHRLGQELLPAAPEVHERLRRAAHIADVGCGLGWSTIGLARAYPQARVDGYDVDGPSVTAANANARHAGVADRAHVELTDGSVIDDERDGTYDAVFAFECIHDMGDPVAVLARMRKLVADDGVVVIMDENVADHFTAPAGPMERLCYGFSLMCCLPDGMSHAHSAGTGTVMRPETLARYARRAGFAGAEALPIEDEFFRFYRLAV